MIALGHALGHRVTAEGVETAEQMTTLSNLGCDEAQGYYFARPLTLAEAEAIVASRSSCRQSARSALAF